MECPYSHMYKIVTGSPGLRSHPFKTDRDSDCIIKSNAKEALSAVLSLFPASIFPAGFPPLVLFPARSFPRYVFFPTVFS